MEFYRPRKKSFVIPIISLIDILTILLIFFIVTTTFKKKKHLIKVSLPSSSVLKTYADPVERVTITVKENGEIFISDRKVAIEKLPEEIKLLRKQQKKVELKMDRRSVIERLLQIREALKKAGFSAKEVPIQIQKKR